MIVDATLDQIVIQVGRGDIVYRELISLPVDYGGEIILDFDADQHLLSIHLIGARNLLPDGIGRDAD
jgi:hypothetical protein